MEDGLEELIKFMKISDGKNHNEVKAIILLFERAIKQNIAVVKTAREFNERISKLEEKLKGEK